MRWLWLALILAWPVTAQELVDVTLGWSFDYPADGSQWEFYVGCGPEPLHYLDMRQTMALTYVYRDLPEFEWAYCVVMACPLEHDVYYCTEHSNELAVPVGCY